MTGDVSTINARLDDMSNKIDIVQRSIEKQNESSEKMMDIKIQNLINRFDSFDSGLGKKIGEFEGRIKVTEDWQAGFWLRFCGAILATFSGLLGIVYTLKVIGIFRV